MNVSAKVQSLAKKQSSYFINFIRFKQVMHNLLIIKILNQMYLVNIELIFFLLILQKINISE